MDLDVEFRILGPIQVVRGGVPLPLGGPRQRAVLARLIRDAGRPVPVDALLDDVWSGRPPPTAGKVLQKYVSELRKVLGADVLQTRAGGYALAVGHATVDAHRFERLVAAGDAAGALALWRGDVLADLPDALFMAAERTRLEELRLVAVQRHLDEELSAGRHAEAVPRLLELTEQHPLREDFCRMLMLGLYRSGRQAEALEAFRRHRRHLVDELGLEPAARLLALEGQILRQEPALDLPPPPPGRPEGNILPPVSLFVGRDGERSAVVAALRAGRLVTLVGPGGVGKTRLAVEVGREQAEAYAGGAWIVDLSPLSAGGPLGRLVAVTLGIGSQPGQDDEETVVAALRHRGPLLLVMDNCEHLADRCAGFVDRIVRRCPRVSVVVTSRRPLGVDGEHVVAVRPLPDAEAGHLFTDRARRAGIPREDAAAALAAGVHAAMDGLPLALELAAVQLRVLGPAQLAARLDDRLSFASARYDTPARQRTLNDLLAWSFALLPDVTQEVFASLGVFASSMSLDAVIAVTGRPDALDHLTVLVDSSMVLREPRGTTAAPRFRLLDTLRLFAQDRLRRSHRHVPVSRAHAGFFLDLASSAVPLLFGPNDSAWLQRLEEEEPNLHAALEWSTAHDPVLALRLGVALWPYWDLRWRGPHGVDHLSAAIDRAGDLAPPAMRARALTAMASLAANPGEARMAQQWAGAAVTALRGAGDQRGLASALVALGAALGNEGALDDAERAVDEALALTAAVGDATLAAQALLWKGFLATRRGDLRAAEAVYRRELAAWSAIGSRRETAVALRHVAATLLHRGALEEATATCERSLGIWRDIGNTAGAAHAQTTLADIARVRHQTARAQALYDEAMTELRRIGDRRCTASTHKNLGLLAATRGEHGAAVSHLQEAVRLRHELGDVAGLAEIFDVLAGTLAAIGRDADAALFRAAADGRRLVPAPHPGARVPPGLDAVVTRALALDPALA